MSGQTINYPRTVAKDQCRPEWPDGLSLSLTHLDFSFVVKGLNPLFENM